MDSELKIKIYLLHVLKKGTFFLNLDKIFSKIIKIYFESKEEIPDDLKYEIVKNYVGYLPLDVGFAKTLRRHLLGTEFEIKDQPLFRYLVLNMMSIWVCNRRDMYKFLNNAMYNFSFSFLSKKLIRMYIKYIRMRDYKEFLKISDFFGEPLGYSAVNIYNEPRYFDENSENVYICIENFREKFLEEDWSECKKILIEDLFLPYEVDYITRYLEGLFKDVDFCREIKRREIRIDPVLSNYLFHMVPVFVYDLKLQEKVEMFKDIYVFYKDKSGNSEKRIEDFLKI